MILGIWEYNKAGNAQTNFHRGKTLEFLALKHYNLEIALHWAEMFGLGHLVHIMIPLNISEVPRQKEK